MLFQLIHNAVGCRVLKYCCQSRRRRVVRYQSPPQRSSRVDSERRCHFCSVLSSCACDVIDCQNGAKQFKHFHEIQNLKIHTNYFSKSNSKQYFSSIVKTKNAEISILIICMLVLLLLPCWFGSQFFFSLLKI